MLNGQNSFKPFIFNQKKAGKINKGADTLSKKNPSIKNFESQIDWDDIT